MGRRIDGMQYLGVDVLFNASGVSVKQGVVFLWPATFGQF